MDLIYADDTDFLSMSDQWLAELEPEVTTILRKWHLKMNLGKTEKTARIRSGERISESWRSSRKLGSLLGDEEDLTRRRQLASAAF